MTDAVRGDARSNAVVGTQPVASQRTPGAEFAGHARQEPGRADVGEKADIHFRHREHEFVASDAMRTVNRDADSAAHDNAVEQRDVGFGIVLDDGIERVFFAPID